MINEKLMIRDLLNGDCSLEKALIVASGVRNEKEVSKYFGKLDLIQQGYHDKIERKGSNRERAQWLFDYIWGRNTDIQNDSSLLTDVVDSKLDLNKTSFCGDCTSLTALYSVLGLRIGIKGLCVGYRPEHIFSFIDNDNLVVETTHPYGFNLPHNEFIEGDLNLIVSRIYNNRAADLIEINKNLALKYFDYSLTIDPKCAESLITRAAVLSRLSEFVRAFDDINNSLDLYPEWEMTYSARAFVRKEFGDISGCLSDLNLAIEINPEDPRPYFGRSEAYFSLGDFEKAIGDFEKARILKMNGPNGI